MWTGRKVLGADEPRICNDCGKRRGTISVKIGGNPRPRYVMRCEQCVERREAGIAAIRARKLHQVA